MSVELLRTSTEAVKSPRPYTAPAIMSLSSAQTDQPTAAAPEFTSAVQGTSAEDAYFASEEYYKYYQMERETGERNVRLPPPPAAAWLGTGLASDSQEGSTGALAALSALAARRSKLAMLRSYGHERPTGSVTVPRSHVDPEAGGDEAADTEASSIPAPDTLVGEFPLNPQPSQTVSTHSSRGEASPQTVTGNSSSSTAISHSTSIDAQQGAVSRLQKAARRMIQVSRAQRSLAVLHLTKFLREIMNTNNPRSKQKRPAVVPRRVWQFLQRFPQLKALSTLATVDSTPPTVDPLECLWVVRSGDEPTTLQMAFTQLVLEYEYQLQVLNYASYDLWTGPSMEAYKKEALDRGVPLNLLAPVRRAVLSSDELYEVLQGMEHTADSLHRVDFCPLYLLARAPPTVGGKGEGETAESTLAYLLRPARLYAEGSGVKLSPASGTANIIQQTTAEKENQGPQDCSLIQKAKPETQLVQATREGSTSTAESEGDSLAKQIDVFVEMSEPVTVKELLKGYRESVDEALKTIDPHYGWIDREEGETKATGGDRCEIGVQATGAISPRSLPEEAIRRDAVSLAGKGAAQLSAMPTLPPDYKPQDVDLPQDVQSLFSSLPNPRTARTEGGRDEEGQLIDWGPDSDDEEEAEVERRVKEAQAVTSSSVEDKGEDWLPTAVAAAGAGVEAVAKDTSPKSNPFALSSILVRPTSAHRGAGGEGAATTTEVCVICELDDEGCQKCGRCGNAVHEDCAWFVSQGGAEGASVRYCSRRCTP
jgi:hypothetical protein